jgi:hypothetical protein
VVNYGRSDVLTVVAIKITVIRGVMQYSLVKIYRRFGGIYCHHLHGRCRQYQIILSHIPDNGSIQAAGFCKLFGSIKSKEFSEELSNY